MTLETAVGGFIRSVWKDPVGAQRTPPERNADVDLPAGRFAFEQVPDRKAQAGEQGVRQLRMQATGALEYFVNVRLRKPRQQSQTALADLSLSYFFVQQQKQAPVEILERHRTV